MRTFYSENDSENTPPYLENIVRNKRYTRKLAKLCPVTIKITDTPKLSSIK